MSNQKETEWVDRYLKFMEPCGAMFTSTYAVGRLKEVGYFDAPASLKHHGNYRGGLIDHSLMVARQLVWLTENLGLQWKNKSSPRIVGMFHDMCKVDDYVPDGVDGWRWNDQSIWPGHGEKSVILTQQLFTLTEEEMLCIRWHMGAFDDKENWSYYTRACGDCQNVLYTHTADMLTSQVMGV